MVFGYRRFILLFSCFTIMLQYAKIIPKRGVNMFEKLKIIKARKKRIEESKLSFEKEIEESKMSLEEILARIDLKVDNWSSGYGTNCLAFALGLDIPYWVVGYSDIYSCGGFYLNFTENPQDISHLKYVEKIELDFNTSGIWFEQIDIGDKIDYSREFKIAFFANDFSSEHFFHVFREGEDGTWYHKRGWSGVPTNLDEVGNIIVNPIERRQIK